MFLPISYRKMYDQYLLDPNTLILLKCGLSTTIASMDI